MVLFGNTKFISTKEGAEYIPTKEANYWINQQLKNLNLSQQRDPIPIILVEVTNEMLTKQIYLPIAI